MTAPSQREANLATGEFYWQGIEQGRLLFQQCGQCGQVRHPPRLTCAACGHLGVEVIESDGRGTVYSYTIVERPRIPNLELPITVVLVVLDEGIRVLGRWETGASPNIGDPVAVRFGDEALGRARLLFRRI